jgi:hypothetical protein
MEASYSIIQRDSEYRILLTPVNTGVLPQHIQDCIAERKIVIKYQE